MFSSENQKINSKVVPITERKRVAQGLEPFFHTSPELLCILSFDGYFQHLSPLWEQTLGFTKEELQSQPWREFIHPEDREATLAEAEKMLNGTQSIVFENRYQCKDGSYKWLAWTATPSVRESCSYCVARDITDQVTRASELVVEQALLLPTQIIDQIHDAVIVCNLHGQITSWNKGAERLFGIPGSQAIAQHISLIYPDDRPSLVPPEALPSGIASVYPTLEQKDTCEFELKMRRKRKESGLRTHRSDNNLEPETWNLDSEQYEHFWAHLSLSLLRESTGNVIGTIAYYLDITPRKQAEEARRESEERYRWLAEHSSDMISRHTIEGIYLYASPASRTLVGYEPDELVGHSSYEFFHPEDLAAIRKTHASILELPDTYTVSYRSRRSDGNYIWLESTTRTVRHPETGAVQEIVCVSRDISSRKQVEEALTQERALLRSLIDSIPDLIFYKNTDGVYLGCNQAFTAYAGMAEKELIGCTDQDIFPADVADFYQQKDRQMLSAGKMQRNEEWIDRPDGGRIWLETLKTPFFGSDGKILGLIGISRDISDRRQAEEALAKLRRQSELILTSAGEGIYGIDRQGNTIFVNPAAARMIGWEAEELIGQSLHAIVHHSTTEGSPYPAAACPIGDTFNDGKVHHIDNEVFWRKDGTCFPVEYISTPILEGGELVGTVVTFQDITQRKQTEETLRQSEARYREKAEELQSALHELKHMQSQLVHTEKMSSLGQLVAGVAHEINNPVNFIYGNIVHASEYTEDLLALLQLYQTYYPSPLGIIKEEGDAIDIDFLVEDLPKMLGSMKLGAERILEIVRSLRIFSRMDDSQMKAVDIHEGIGSTLLILQNRIKTTAGHPGIAIVKDFGDLPQVECYPGQLNQVFMNLLANAIDALEEYNATRSPADITANPSTIAIRTELVSCQSPVVSGNAEPTTDNPQRTTDSVVIRICDNGPGIPADVKPHLFDPFFTTKPAGKGTGLGLSISHQIIVDKHRGVLKCISEPGQGAEFRIEIPLFQRPV